jgi:transcriptional regulator with XRE-family HTH domain
MSGCERCGVSLSRHARAAVCPTCSAGTALSPRPPRLALGMWMWSDPAARTALGSRDLATILRAYRAANRLSQEALAALLGYDKSHVAMIETRKRNPGDVAGRRHVARALGMPYHVLGVTDPDDVDFASLVQFGDSVVRWRRSLVSPGGLSRRSTSSGRWPPALRPALPKAVSNATRFGCSLPLASLSGCPWGRSCPRSA